MIGNCLALGYPIVNGTTKTLDTPCTECLQSGKTITGLPGLLVFLSNFLALSHRDLDVKRGQ